MTTGQGDQEVKDAHYKDIFFAYFQWMCSIQEGGKYNLERELCRIFEVDSIKHQKVPESVQSIYVIMTNISKIINVSRAVRLNGEATVDDLMNLEKAMETKGKNEDGTEYVPPAAFKDIWVKYQSIAAAYETSITKLGDSLETVNESWQGELGKNTKYDAELVSLRGKLDAIIARLETELGEGR